MKYSIIVVAYNIENFIEECLESCIFKGRTDYEVLVVYNASNDRTLDSIKRVTSRYPGIFSIIENDENVGLGEARNQGMRAARGEYYIFLDGDDFFSADALPKIAGAIEANSPDVLVINFVRYHQDARQEENKQTPFLQPGWKNSTDERKRLLRNFGVAWNKVYSKSFVDRHNLSFPSCYYEDIVWNAECILRAGSIYTIPDVLVFYRQRPGSILRSTDPRHFDTIKQHREIIRVLSADLELADKYAQDLRKYSRNQMFATLHLGGRIPAGSEGKFLKEVSKTLDMYDALIGARTANLRERTARTGSHFLYRLYRFADLNEPKVKAYLNHTKQRIQRPFEKRLHRSFKWFYRNLFLRMPIKNNRVIFDSFWGQRPDGNPLAIYNAIANNKSFDCAYMLRRDAVTPKGKTFNRVGRSSFRGYLYLATAKYLVTNSAFPDDYVKRPGQIFVQTQHGTPFKYMGLQQRLVQPKAMNWWHLALRTRIWDYVISANKYSTAVWRKAYPYNYKVIETGYPANDELINASAEKRSSVRDSIRIPDGKKIALYAPTFRDSDKNKPVELEDFLDLTRVSEALGDDYVLLVRSHYFARGVKSGTSSVIDVSSYPCTNDLLAITDLLISDYSSIMVDFANLGRPIVLYAYDYEKYKAERGMYLSLDEINPCVVATTLDDLCDKLESREYDSPSSRERLWEFRQKFCEFDDGHATDRVLEEVFGIKSAANSGSLTNDYSRRPPRSCNEAAE